MLYAVIKMTSNASAKGTENEGPVASSLAITIESYPTKAKYYCALPLKIDESPKGLKPSGVVQYAK